jgi:hypothetical protein
MSQDMSPKPTQTSRGPVRIRIEACGGALAVTVVIDDSKLALPADHCSVTTGSTIGSDGPCAHRYFETHPTLQGRFCVTQTVGERFEFGTYTTDGDNHRNPYTEQLLGCFTSADRTAIDEHLVKLATDRKGWWDADLADHAARLGKPIDELTTQDTLLRITSAGHRNYPLYDPTPQHNTYPTFQVDRDHLEAHLQLLLGQLLDEAVPAL